MVQPWDVMIYETKAGSYFETLTPKKRVNCGVVAPTLRPARLAGLNDVAVRREIYYS